MSEKGEKGERETRVRQEMRRREYAYLDRRIPELHAQGYAGSDAAKIAKAEWGKMVRDSANGKRG